MPINKRPKLGQVLIAMVEATVCGNTTKRYKCFCRREEEKFVSQREPAESISRAPTSVERRSKPFWA
jgi:hypothetical protein